MLDLIYRIPDQLKYGWKTAAEIIGSIPARPPRSLAVCGMGGSGISGDLIRGLLLQTSTIPVEVIKDYSLPGWIDKDWFAVVISYSGNTEETLSLWEELSSRGVPRMVVTSGGKLEKLVQDSHVPVVKIPGGNPPRASVGYLFSPLLRLVHHWGLYPDASDELDFTVNMIRSRMAKWEDEARSLAESIENKFPIIHVLEPRFLPVGYRFSCQLNENSKALAHVHVYSEMNHNEIMGFEGGVGEDLAVVVLDPGDGFLHPRNRKRERIVSNILPPSLPACTIKAEGDSLLERFFSLLVKCDLVSVFLAEITGVDPLPVDSIERLKKELG